MVRRPSTSTDPTTSRAALVGPAVAATPLQQAPSYGWYGIVKILDNMYYI